MRTRTFIGLVILIIALVVASTPVLLEAASRGLIAGALRTGAITKPKTPKASPDAGPVKPVAAQLNLKGYALQKSGDLRDTAPLGTRRFDETGRLAAGNDRQRLPNEQPGTTHTAPPYSGAGMLQDASGCPVFRPETDVAAFMADPKTKAAYDKQAAKSTDPTCPDRMAAAIEDATTDSSPAAGGATVRQLRALERESIFAAVIDLEQISLISDLVDLDSLQETAEDLE